METSGGRECLGTRSCGRRDVVVEDGIGNTQVYNDLEDHHTISIVMFNTKTISVLSGGGKRETPMSEESLRIPSPTFS